MDPRRRQRRNGGRGNGGRGDGGRNLAETIAQAMAAAMPNMVVQIQQQLNNQANQGDANPPRCSYKHFKSCDPPKYNGVEGATALLNWFEGMESTFAHSGCPDNLKVNYASGTLQKRALTWWNGEKHRLGEAATTALTWADLRGRMTREFCPRNEVKKLEQEFRDLKQDGGENLAYNNRFHELSVLCPSMVEPEDKGIELYIDGLPGQIRGSVISSKPATIAEAVQMAATLTDDQVRSGTLKRKGAKKEEAKSSDEPPKVDAKINQTPTTSTPTNTNNKRRVNQFNYAIPAIPLQQTTPITQPNKKPYTGGFPLCNACNFHHLPTTACRLCINCNRLGHFATTCRAPRAQVNQPRAQGNQQRVQNPPNVPLLMAPNTSFRACFQCGDPNHFINVCPLRLDINNVATNQVNQGNQGTRARVYNANVDLEQNNNEGTNT